MEEYLDLTPLDDNEPGGLNYYLASAKANWSHRNCGHSTSSINQEGIRVFCALAIGHPGPCLAYLGGKINTPNLMFYKWPGKDWERCPWYDWRRNF